MLRTLRLVFVVQVKQLHEIPVENLFRSHPRPAPSARNRASSSLGDHIGKSVPNKNRSGPNLSSIRSTMSRGIIGSVLDVSYSTQLGSGHSYECAHARQPPKCAAITCRSGTCRKRFISRSGVE